MRLHFLINNYTPLVNRFLRLIVIELLSMDGLAHKIRYARRNKNLSQKKLGKKLELSEMAISAYETGRATPPWPTLKKISDITGFSLEYFTEKKNKNVSLESLDKNIKKIQKGVSKILKILKAT